MTDLTIKERKMETIRFTIFCISNVGGIIKDMLNYLKLRDEHGELPQ